jgi:hypothetical protein
MHEVAKHHKRVFRMFNEHPLFWTTLRGGVQTAALIAVGRVFDQNSTHNLDAVLGLAQRNRDIFSRASLGKRKQGNARQEPDWLQDYLRTAYEPTPTDFRRLRKLVKKYRRIYETNYRDLRNQYYAHKAAADPPRSTNSSPKRTSEKCNACSPSSYNCTNHSKSSSQMDANPSSAPCGTPHNASNDNHRPHRPERQSTNTSPSKQNKHSSASHKSRPANTKTRTPEKTRKRAKGTRTGCSGIMTRRSWRPSLASVSLERVPLAGAQFHGAVCLE